jgi:hypothetical protein
MWLMRLLGENRVRRIAVEWLYSFHVLNKFSPQARNADPLTRHPVFPEDLKREWEKQNTRWDWHETPRGPIMRCRVNGKWETRPMTAEELHNYEGTRIGW